MPDCDFYESDINEYIAALRKKSYDNKVPFKGGFELTPRCNFNCNMCYVHLQPDEIPAVGRELSTDEWVQLGREAQKAGTIELTLTGGEPFIRPDFREIYEALHDMGFLIQIFSNGSLLDEATMAWLMKRPPRAMRFTLYGAGNETYERVCGIRNGYDRVKRSIDLVRKSGIPLYLAATVTKENEKELPRIYQFAAENRLNVTHTSVLINPVRGASANAKEHQAEQKLPPPEIIKRIREYGKGKYPRKPCTDFLKVCTSYRCGYWITWNGQMQLCTFLTEPAVPVRPKNFAQSWHEMQDAVSALRQPAECESCLYETYCDRCPGILYAEAGENGKITPEYCEKAYYNYKLYGEQLSGQPGEQANDEKTVFKK